ncbi:H(+)-transporting V1 sector ATPase subunit G Ecym_3182 [Eremothecium cymbalariae DBVPG|uniref:V-type proton ATPase subunit G n=1 Tax=Eremothecium cymbalariae (strain CBS 270.75 / DBVPG 7215 / KCTC 17166 / NRRL Y-17582) TaxID=931890 RepID=G8JRB2_ERECY|nr:Hypothetical protein Ecym_3182 [Eremothecium cymbalariae DBVPG\
MSQSNGIATLLKAEKEAHEIVAKARRYRQEKLKQAKLDASKEINEYKAQMDQELRDHEAANVGWAENLEKEAERKVQTELEQIKRLSSQKKDAIVSTLITAVTKPQHEVHINASS